MILAVTGTPGTGKTTVATYIEEHFGYTYIDGNQFVTESICEQYDEARDCKVVDVEKWVKAVETYLKEKNIEKAVVDSHFSHDLPVDVVSVCIVTVCENRTVLRQRLLERGYSKEKIDENIEAELFDICAIEAQENGHKIYKLDTCDYSWKKRVPSLLLKQ